MSRKERPWHRYAHSQFGYLGNIRPMQGACGRDVSRIQSCRTDIQRVFSEEAEKEMCCYLNPDFRHIRHIVAFRTRPTREWFPGSQKKRRGGECSRFVHRQAALQNISFEKPEEETFHDSEMLLENGRQRDMYTPRWRFLRVGREIFQKYWWSSPSAYRSSRL